MPSKKSTSDKITRKKARAIPVKNLASKRVVGPKAQPQASSKKEGFLKEYREASPKHLPKKSKPQNLYRSIAYTFIFLTALLLAAIFYFSFVKLTITIIPAEERINSNLIIDINDKDKGGKEALAQDVIGGAVEEIEIQKKKSYNSSGAEIIGEEVTGEVTIVNNYSKSQPLVATTRLLTSDNKLFRIKKTVNVPAGGSVKVEVYADEPGPAMAIGPSKFTIPGLWAGLQDKIYAESQESFVYKQQIKKYIQQADIDRAVIDLKKALLEEAKRKLGNSYKGYDKVIYELDENSISTSIDGKVGEEKESFEAEMKTKVVVVAFSAEKVEALAKEKLSMMIPDNKELIEFDKDEIKYEMGTYSVKQGLATVNASFEGLMALSDKSDIIDRNKIIGLTRAQLEEYLKGFPEIQGFEIKFFPGFINKVPNLVDRIKIKVKQRPGA